MKFILIDAANQEVREVDAFVWLDAVALGLEPERIEIERLTQRAGRVVLAGDG